MYSKINKYVFIQILKSCTLIFFIFTCIAWLLQVTRLFNLSNLIQIDVLSIIYLSLFLIPNLLSVLFPFIVIFGILLCFTKLNKDKEIIAIYSLGLSIKSILKPLILFSGIVIIIQIILNSYLSPVIYDEYKLREFKLRNTINIDKLMISNFLKINENTTIDFKRKNNNYEDIFINFNDEKENFIFAKLGVIENNINEFVFKLYDGYKLSITLNNELEKLEFTNYTINFKNENNIEFSNIDKNTLTIFDDLNSRDYRNIAFKFSDSFIIILIIYVFYKNNIKHNIFTARSNLMFILYSITILIINQFLKNSELSLEFYIVIYILSFLSIIILSQFKFIDYE